jgi:hypothetical protein
VFLMILHQVSNHEVGVDRPPDLHG